eukprot:CAMPEP_0206245710 /NCGR_PEP_ID=MMETSP0047_2-20121206/18844_1 /ASSEMBLY_ACC=CAM_ASM_000192 /TAXON_ID=195065 /ORGANISM="Chroomonas mesostigmatica_cf, Strain CCMP1168" /LENGTH=191 /DNA_ID=CAMNT_0053671031 /DNA_START=33 /DNA_END=608 /DNA_ORIENTATION=-
MSQQQLARRMGIVDRPLPRGKTEVSLSAFAFLFSEMVQYYQQRVNTTQELERKLAGAGYGVGVRMLELVVFREKGSKRETRVIGMLSFIKDNMWKTMFGKPADSLERVTDKEDEYMINEKEPLVNTFISVPKDLGHLNCAAFVAGVVHGILDSADFPSRVTAHTVPVGGETRTTILIKFDAEVMEREKRMG